LQNTKQCYKGKFPVYQKTTSIHPAAKCSTAIIKCVPHWFLSNCRGIRSKHTTFICNISSFSYAFIVLTETWLTNYFHDYELGMFNYNIYRYDRCAQTNSCSRGGGVLIGIRKDIPSRLVNVSEVHIERIFVQFSLGNCSYIPGGVYIPSHIVSFPCLRLSCKIH